MGVSISSSANVAPVAPAADASNVERNIVAVQARHMESEETELEEDGDVDASSVSTEDTVALVDSKVANEQLDTTPTLDSNGLV